MPDRRIFVSYGQLTEPERTLGRALRDVIAARGMTAFVAGEVHSAAGLNAEVHEAIRTCHAFLAVLHHRGEIRFPDFPDAQRSSVWIQQEIAIFSYRMFLERTPRPIMVYSQRGIRPEGLMQAAIVNPLTFDTDEEVIAGVDAWLQGREFEEDPILTKREALFHRRIEQLTEDEFLLLELLSAHLISPDDRVDYETLRADFCSDLGSSPPPGADEGILHRLETARKRLSAHALVGWEVSSPPGMPPDRVIFKKTAMWIQRQWWDLILDELRSRGRA